MNKPDTLFLLWTSGEVATFDEMVFMYALNAKKRNWWQEVTVIIWGASATLVGNDNLVQLKIKELIEGGVKVDGHPAGIHVFLYYWTKLFGTNEWIVKLPFIVSVSTTYTTP